MEGGPTPRLQGILAPRAAPAAAGRPSPAEARAAAQAFEALFVHALLKAARPASPTGVWQDRIEAHLAEAIAAGAPFGLAAALFADGQAR